MTLGQRLKQARQENGLSQRQLSQGIVTRNMLSLLESDSARPSMDTLTALAARLGKPVSWFLEEQTSSPNQNAIVQARQEFRKGNYGDCLKCLENWQADGVFDEEKGLLEFLCLVHQAQAVAGEKPRYALELLERAKCVQSLYRIAALDRELALAGYEVSRDSDWAAAVVWDDRPLLLRGQAALEAGDGPQACRFLRAAQESPRRQLLLGQAMMAQGQFREAAQVLQEAEGAFPRQCVALLERCYRELEDYKMAYAYACKTRENN